MDSKAEFEFIAAFVREQTFNDSIEREQFRVLWTAYCLHQNMDCDTQPYDKDIEALWDAVIKRTDIYESSDKFHDLYAFGNYMAKYLC